MKCVIIYYSQHHGNTKKLVNAISSKYQVTLINVLEDHSIDLNDYDLIGIASGIYFSSFSKQILDYASKYLPKNKKVFFMNTCGFSSPIIYFDAIRKISLAKNCIEIGTFQCLGYDTFGPFKVIGGIAKGHPNDKDIDNLLKFYQKMIEKMEVIS